MKHISHFIEKAVDEILTKEERRAAMPKTSEFVDDIKEAFGADAIKSIKASENGHTVTWERKTTSVSTEQPPTEVEAK